MKKCPYCAEEIQDEAVKCKHCGSNLDGSPEIVREKGKKSGLKLKLIGIFLMVISFFVCFTNFAFGASLFLIGFFVAVAGRALD